MLGYHISQSNSYTIRTSPTASTEFTMSLQNMYELVNTTASLSGITYEPFESLLSFTASISGAIISSEWRATLYNSGSSDAIWHGTFQAFASASLSIPNSDYENLNKQYISNPSENKYIIMT